MKRILTLVLALALTLSFAACSGNKTDNATDTDTTSEVVSDVVSEVDDTLNSEEVVDDGADDGEVAGFTLPEGTTFANYLLEDFKAIVTENTALTAEEIATELSVNEAILFASMAMPVEEGALSGFTTDITGFESAAMFGPMMGSIAFVGYVFDLADDADVDAFMQTLKDNSDPRWQICVEAEETVCEAEGDKVFFVMAPLSNK